MAEVLSRAYCTLDQVKIFLGMATTDTSKDDLLTLSVNAASRRIDSLTGEIFYKKTYTDVYLGNEFKIYQAVQYVQNSFFTLPYAPVITMTIYASDGTALVNRTDYRINDDTNIVEAINRAWTEKYYVTCELGMDEDAVGYAVPEDIVDYTMELAAVRSGLWKRTTISEYDGSIQNFVVTKISKDTLTALKNYKRIK